MKLALFTLPTLANLSAFGQQGASGQGKIAKLLNSNPEGRYVVSMEFAGGKPRVIVDVGERDVKTVKGSDPEFDGMAGTIERLKPGIFRVIMRNAKHTISQIWIFRPDGNAAVREVPDRGEMQTAVRVSRETSELPK